MRGPGQLCAVCPFLQQLSEEDEERGISASRKVVWVYIEYDILQEILKFQPLDIHKIVEQFGKHPGLQDHSLNDIDDGMMIALKDGAVLCSLYKDNFPLRHFPLKTHAVLEIAEMAH